MVSFAARGVKTLSSLIVYVVNTVDEIERPPFAYNGKMWIEQCEYGLFGKCKWVLIDEDIYCERRK